MAGTLPGVEAARRRRFHHSASDNAASWIRKSSFRREFCSATSCPSSSSLRSACYGHEHHDDDEMLGGVAREAKERLDEKLRNQRKLILAESIASRNTTKGSRGVVAEGQGAINVAQSGQASVGLKRSGSKRLMGLAGWTKLRWKASEQEECAICLDRLNSDQVALATLPCAHRFHSKCLVPWIESNAHCPCCRMSLTTSNNAKSSCKF
uniref:RING-type E3 ubiquitin transferase n=1 Tax=Kalanchoe fedtschenkoi TaxID=63787 RepID=A0A7N0RG66_KALFE